MKNTYILTITSKNVNIEKQINDNKVYELFPASLELIDDGNMKLHGNIVGSLGEYSPVLGNLESIDMQGFVSTKGDARMDDETQLDMHIKSIFPIGDDRYDDEPLTEVSIIIK